MDVILAPLIQVLLVVINLYIWVLILSAVMSWLIYFGVINTYNRFVSTVMDILYRLTDPVLRPVRNLLPNFGGMDLSPLVVILALYFVQNVLVRLNFRLFG